MSETDYAPGDPPVAVGTVVEYFGSCRNREYEITAHAEPDMMGHPGDLAVFFPDGVAYTLWVPGVARKFGNREHSISNVRRTSFRIVQESLL